MGNAAIVHSVLPCGSAAAGVFTGSECAGAGLLSSQFLKYNTDAVSGICGRSHGIIGTFPRGTLDYIKRRR